MKIKTAVFYQGYAESWSPKCLILKHEIGFDSVEELIDSLIKFIPNQSIEDKSENWSNFLHYDVDGYSSYLDSDNNDIYEELFNCSHNWSFFDLMSDELNSEETVLFYHSEKLLEKSGFYYHLSGKEFTYVKNNSTRS